MLGNVYHVGYNTDDVGAAIALYERTFGGKLLKRTESAAATMAFVQVGDSEVELIEPKDKARLGGKKGLIIDHVGYITDDLDKAMADLAAKGVKFATPAPTLNQFGLRMIFLDAECTLGTRVHLTEVK